MHGTFLSFPRRGDSVVFAGLEQAQNLAGKDIRRPISDPFSRCRVCGKLSQIVKAIRRKHESQMSIRERAVAWTCCASEMERGVRTNRSVAFNLRWRG